MAEIMTEAQFIAEIHRLRAENADLREKIVIKDRGLDEARDLLRKLAGEDIHNLQDEITDLHAAIALHEKFILDVWTALEIKGAGGGIEEPDDPLSTTSKVLEAIRALKEELNESIRRYNEMALRWRNILGELKHFAADNYELKALLASGILLPEVDLEGEIVEGQYFVYEQGDKQKVMYASKLKNEYRNNRFRFHEVLRAFGPLPDLDERKE